MKRSALLILAVMITTFGTSGVQAIQTIKEHPVIRPVPGFTVQNEYSEHKSYHVYGFRVLDAATGNLETKNVSGEYWYYYYEAHDNDGNIDQSISFIEIVENFKAAATEKNGTVLLQDDINGYLTFTVPSDTGGMIWCFLEAGTGSYSIYIVQEKAFTKKLTFSADEIQRELDEKGRIAIYGILFDLDKADLKLESIAPLQEMVKLLLTNPELKIEIQGHTDNQGDEAHNMRLSEARANSVKIFMTLFGIDAQRLTSKGYGQSMPISSNDTDEGRQLNRRVELVKR
ncbi:OmpA family protein [bacterium]|nr:OmpA family protein [candidate division CSSED10-310 bacterium]